MLRPHAPRVDPFAVPIVLGPMEPATGSDVAGAEISAFLKEMDNFTPTVSSSILLASRQTVCRRDWCGPQIPDEAMDYYLSRTGFQCPDQRV